MDAPDSTLAGGDNQTTTNPSSKTTAETPSAMGDDNASALVGHADTAMDTGSPAEAVAMDAEDEKGGLVDSAMESPRPVDSDMPSATEAMDAYEASSAGDAVMPSPRDDMETASEEEAVAMEAEEDLREKIATDKQQDEEVVDSVKRTVEVSQEKTNETTDVPVDNNALPTNEKATDVINFENDEEKPLAPQEPDDATPLGVISSIVGNVTESFEAGESSDNAPTIGELVQANQDEEPMFQISCVQSGVSLDDSQTVESDTVAESTDALVTYSEESKSQEASGLKSSDDAGTTDVVDKTGEQENKASSTVENTNEEVGSSELKQSDSGPADSVDKVVEQANDAASTSTKAVVGSPKRVTPSLMQVKQEPPDSTAEHEDSETRSSVSKDRPVSRNESVVSALSAKVKSEPEEPAAETQVTKETVEKAKTTDVIGQKADSTARTTNSGKGDKSDKPKSKKQHKCIVCGTIGKCKYNIVRNGDVKHLCNDQCFKTFRASPSQYLSNQAAAAEAAAAAVALPPPPQLTRRCASCLKTQDKSALSIVWQTLEFCGELCLDRFLKTVGPNCGSCKKALPDSVVFRYCTAYGNAVVQFCTPECRDEFSQTVKNCSYCHQNIANVKEAFMAPVNNGTTFHDFCSPVCHQAFEKRASNLRSSIDSTPKDSNDKRSSKTTRSTSGLATCFVCGKMANYKHELTLEDRLHRLCSDPCFAAFRYAKRLNSNLCDNCSIPCDSSALKLQFEGVEKKFCARSCLTEFKRNRLKSVNCAWCAMKRTNFDMIEKVEKGKFQLFCSLSCLSLFRVNIQASSSRNVKCDQCFKYVPAQFHLTMSDASVRNFCSYGCVMAFQDQFKSKTPTQPVVQKHQIPTLQPMMARTTPTQTQTQQQQQQNSQSRVMTMARMPQMTQMAQTGQQRMNGTVVVKTQSNRTGTVPVISNVMSLAPLAKETATKPATQVQIGTKAQAALVKKETIVSIPPPSIMRNKAVLCKAACQTKATTCRPHTTTVSCQTDEWAGLHGVPIPIPVPIFVPVPVIFYNMPTPHPVAIPVPVPIPCFIPTGTGSADQVLKKIEEIRERIPSDPFEAELLMMAEAVASASDSPLKKAPVAETNGDAAESKHSADESLSFTNDADMLSMALKMAEEMEGDVHLDLETSLDNPNNTTEPSPAEPKRRAPKRSASRGRGRGRSKRQKVDEEETATTTPPPQVPPTPAADADCVLKYTYGVNAWKHWVRQKNSDLENELKNNPRARPFKNELLECSADELNYALSLFVKEVRKPNGQEYAADSIYYLCLGIQAYLYNNNRADNIFTDVYYEKFTDCLNEIISRFVPRLSPSGELLCRLDEDHLWECKQLGAHSPHVLLNTLIYFNTRSFHLKTSDEHLKLAFSHVMKAWKRNPAGTQPSRTVYLRYYAPAKDSRRRKDEGDFIYEQVENLTNPLRCPVKLFEFYVSKCPESIKNRSDLFYLVPERSCVPDSPVWYSVAPLGHESMNKMLSRLKLVRELQSGQD